MPDTIDDVDEHPIIFNEWSINRILRDEKTQTRRVITPKPPKGYDNPVCEGGKLRFVSDHHGVWPNKGFTGKKISPNLCGWHAGDVLWVREAFRLPHTYDQMSPSEYVDEFQPHIVRFEADEGDYNAVPKDGWGRKRPSIHMPRELCRLRLRVEDVRVERVQEISGEDARAEGCLPDTQSDGAARLEFFHKWEDIHGDGAWERNDWVWVIEFSQIGNT